MTDAWITTRVHGRFVNETLLKDSDIGVDVSDHVVTLKGTVLTAMAGARRSPSRNARGRPTRGEPLTVGPKR